tara:strand:- start:130 stop:1107 length:978 start_codon:yes stop_codon:yes gene_type:complete
MNKLIAVTIGDINGIGIDIFIKLFLNKKIKNVVLFCNIKIIKNYLKKNKINLKINLFNKTKVKFVYKKNLLNIYSYKSNSDAKNTIDSIIFSHNECIKKKFIGIVTLPIRKDIIIKKIDRNFMGHTEFLQNLENKKYTNMILIHEKIIVSPLTTHISLNSVSKKIMESNYIYNQILNLYSTLKKDLNIKKPKMILSGLNPHAGESGKIGNEELKINKIINKLKDKKIDIKGTVSADSMLLDIENYDCFIFMYHDQALIPFKYISKFSGVNFTGNLDIIRVSPDHGTAYALKGTKKISDTAVKKCFILINKINKNRSVNYVSKKIS